MVETMKKCNIEYFMRRHPNFFKDNGLKDNFVKEINIDQLKFLIEKEDSGKFLGFAAKLLNEDAANDLVSSWIESHEFNWRDLLPIQVKYFSTDKQFLQLLLLLEKKEYNLSLDEIEAYTTQLMILDFQTLSIFKLWLSKDQNKNNFEGLIKALSLRMLYICNGADDASISRMEEKRKQDRRIKEELVLEFLGNNNIDIKQLIG